MAEKITYPKIPVRQWWLLRTKFKQSIPTTVSASYLATALGMTEASAKNNILPSLIAFKIVDADGKTGERAKQWRDDEKYPDLCLQLLKEIYPEDLVHAQPPPIPNKDAVIRWFSNATGIGEGGAKQMSSVYELLCQAKPLDKEEEKNLGTRKTPSDSATKGKTKLKQKTEKEEAISTNEGKDELDMPKKDNSNRPKFAPSIHIDVQIHISPESSADQINQIFESMGKHLGKLANGTNE